MRKTIIVGTWGWNGKSDQTAYEVYVLKQPWGTYCYLRRALAVADRIEHADDETCKVEKAPL